MLEQGLGSLATVISEQRMTCKIMFGRADLRHAQPCCLPRLALGSFNSNIMVSSFSSISSSWAFCCVILLCIIYIEIISRPLCDGCVFLCVFPSRPLLQRLPVRTSVCVPLSTRLRHATAYSCAYFAYLLVYVRRRSQACYCLLMCLLTYVLAFVS